MRLRRHPSQLLPPDHRRLAGGVLAVDQAAGARGARAVPAHQLGSQQVDGLLPAGKGEFQFLQALCGAALAALPACCHCRRVLLSLLSTRRVLERPRWSTVTCDLVIEAFSSRARTHQVMMQLAASVW